MLSSADRQKVAAKVRSLLDDLTGDADRDLGQNATAQMAGKARSILDDLTGDADRDLSGPPALSQILAKKR